MMEKKRLLFSINQFYKGGAETALLNLFQTLSPDKYEIDFLIFDQIDLKGSLSLVPQIPSWIHVINVGERERWFAYFKKAYFHVYRDLTQKQLFRRSVHRYLKDKFYDVAISFGEWFSCAPIATMVRATRKYVWIHADMDKADFLHPDILTYQQYFDQFIFVSAQSQRGAEKRYPFLRDRCAVIHNMVNTEELGKRSEEKVELPFPADGLPVLVTVANLRPEKNHVRQIQAMKLLRKEGILFHWLNIGSLANQGQVLQVEQAVRTAGLEEDFKLIGAMENPYPYMKAAEAVCVLSDHESWSMVITEAKTLGVPVIATQTSGALEQIVHGETGVLCDFTAEDIATKIKTFLCSPQIRINIQQNLKDLSGQGYGLSELEALLFVQKKKLLYLFDDVNYQSGARRAAFAQMEILKEETDLTLFTAQPCQDAAVLKQYHVFDLGENLSFRCLYMSCKCVFRGKRFSLRQKLLRAAYAVLARIKLDYVLYYFLLGKNLTCFLSGFDVLCVMSEASRLRTLVSSLDGPRKVQWIHTDYAAWREHSSWTRAITSHDGEIYRRYDAVVLLSERLKERFVNLYPHLADRAVVVPNLIDYDGIVRSAQSAPTIAVNRTICNLITVGRMEKEKRYDRLLEVAAALKEQTFPFHWYFVGDGSLFLEIQSRRDSLGLSEVVTLTGALENPYPLMSQCNLFVLCSDYEGTPVTIDEAKVLGVFVLAADVGGISEQLDQGRFGRVISPNPPRFVDEITVVSQDYSNTACELTETECCICNNISITALKASTCLSLNSR